MAQQSLLEKWASQQGWNMEFAHDAAMKYRYDVILLDVEFPNGFSGLDVKAVFDDRESLRGTPVISISNRGQPQDIEQAMQAGFTTYQSAPHEQRRHPATGTAQK